MNEISLKLTLIFGRIKRIVRNYLKQIRNEKNLKEATKYLPIFGLLNTEVKKKITQKSLLRKEVKIDTHKESSQYRGENYDTLKESSHYRGEIIPETGSHNLQKGI